MYKILSVLFFFIFPLMGIAQSQATFIPIDSSVRIGKLSNGLTYYLKQNNQPEQRANFYLVQRVGSLQENDDQQGLAHFLEHMCFNGTKHFPKDAIIRYFETLGVKFGEHLNASTSMDRTIYHISDVPAMRQSTLDSCLLILKDWASDLTLDPTEIDKERGVIYEEWRTRTSPSSRLTERNLSKLYPGSKYGTRMPIGKMEIINSFKPTTLYDFYKTWYRPDNQAVIIVGDIDVDHMEQQVKEYFGCLTTTGQPLVKAEPVPDNNEAIIIADQDKEQATDFVQVFFKCAPITPTMKATEAYVTYQVTKDMAMNMLRQRILERAQSPDCPFLNGAVGYGAYLFANTKYAFQLSILPKKNETARSVAVLLEESLRAMRHGFTPTEFVRAQAHSKMYLDRRYANRHQQTNALLGNAYTEHFLTNEPIPSIEDHYRLRSRVINTLTLEDINRFAARLIASKDTNVVMLHYSKAEDSTPQPAPQMLKSILDSVWHQPLTPYEDKVTNAPLMTTLPKKGSIKRVRHNRHFGCRELLLSNGVKVILKSTDEKGDEILMRATSAGGSSLLEEADYVNAKFFNQAIGQSAIGHLSAAERQKALAGNTATAHLSLGIYDEKVSGSSALKDLETLFQLTHLCFTDIRPDRQAFGRLLHRYRTTLQSKPLSADMALSDSLVNTLHAHHPRYTHLSAEDLDRVDYDRILQIAKERTANAADFTFIFVGHCQDSIIFPLIEQYIASLPSSGRKERLRDIDGYAKSPMNNHFKRKMETPKAKAYLIWLTDAVAYTLDNKIKAEIIGQMLTATYIKKIREEASAAYSADSYGILSKEGAKPYVRLYAICPMKPEKAEQALHIMRKEVVALGHKVDAEQLDAAKQYLLKKQAENATQHHYWLTAIEEYHRHGLDVHTDYRRLVDTLTPEALSAFVRNVILSSGIRLEVVMLPE